MILIITILLAIIFFSLSGIHVYWLFGGQRGLEASIPVTVENENAKKEFLILNKFKPSYTSMLCLALVYNSIGDIDNAKKYLNKAIEKETVLSDGYLGLEKLELNYWQKRIEKFKTSEKSEESNFQESTNLEIGA